MTLRRTSKLAFASALLGAILAEPAAAATAPTVDCGGTNRCIELGSRWSEERWPIAPGTYTLKIQNLLPKAKYRVTVDTEQYQLIASPISLPKAGKDQVTVKSACDASHEVLVALYNAASDETAIRNLNKTLPSQLTDCEAAEAATKRQALLDSTTEVKQTLTVAEHTQVIVTVERLEPTVKRFGPYTFATPRPPGQWLIYYGFNYIWQNNEEYFAKPNANTMPQTYTVTGKSDVGGSSFSPSLYFMWFSADRPFDEWGSCWLSCSTKDRFRGVTAGIGFDFDNPTLFVGYGVGWGYNVMLNAGVAMSKVTRLAGQYRKGDIVNEPLTDTQLSDETYQPYAYFGAAFRFGESPWESSKTPPAPPAPKTEPNTPATPSPDTPTEDSGNGGPK